MPSLLTRATAALDRGAVRLMERRLAPRTPKREPIDDDARAKLIAVAAHYRDGTLGVPSPFFPDPELPAMQLTPQGDGPLGTQIVHMKWRSGYEPYFTHARELHDSTPENHVAYARWWTSPARSPRGQNRPTIVILHGWGADRPAVNERAFVVPYWLSHGYDVVAYVLPYHGPRGPTARSGALFPSSNPLRTNEGFGQAIYDLRGLAMFLRSRGSSAVGAIGMSLGGYTTALWASVAGHLPLGPQGHADLGGIDFAVAMIPAVSFSRLFWQHGEQNPTRREATRLGITEELLADAFAVHAPTTRPVRIARERLAVIAGRGDRITPPDHAETLARHWGVDALWFDGGHLVQAGRGDAMRTVRRQLDALDFPGRTRRK